MKKLLYIYILFSFTCKAQFLYLQDNYKGGISSDGKSYPGMTYLQADTINFQNSVPGGAVIKKAFLISQRGFFNILDPDLKDNPMQFIFNSDTVVIDSSNIFTSFRCSSNINADHAWMVVKDVTALTQQSGNKLITPCQSCLLSAHTDYNYVYIAFLLVILYEDNTMPATNVAVFLNDKTYNNNMTYYFNGLNPINTAQDAGLSIWVDNVPKPDSVTFILNSATSSYLGALYEPDPVPFIITKNTMSKLPGSFYYQNNTLFGLVDDTPDNKLDSTDALVNIKNYVSNNTTNFNVDVTLKPGGGCLNEIDAYIFAYTTPCPARSIMPTQTYSLCGGQSLQLTAASGASQYTWLPNSGLNNNTIYNPIATPTLGTTNYIVKVDSMGCKHTEHFNLSVYPSPTADTLIISNAICGDTRGALTINNVQGGLPPYHYNIGGANQSSNNFSNINPGTYTATVTDTTGCTFKKSFSITETNPAIATFSIQPTSACINQLVNFFNTSAGTNLYWWSFGDNDTTNTENQTHNYIDTGSYIITLIAWHNQRQCSDTITHSITVKECPPDSISITAPNIFTPNGDDINETWLPVIYNLGFTINDFSIAIFDRWGLKVFESTTINNGWDGHTTSGLACIEGTYYYILHCKAANTKSETKEINLKGFLQLIK